ncbi:hypothetical protein PFISCL1PPCAC_11548, partial [Pristionchus fissidentatus]
MHHRVEGRIIRNYTLGQFSTTVPRKGRERATVLHLVLLIPPSLTPLLHVVSEGNRNRVNAVWEHVLHEQVGPVVLLEAQPVVALVTDRAVVLLSMVSLHLLEAVEHVVVAWSRTLRRHTVQHHVSGVLEHGVPAHCLRPLLKPVRQAPGSGDGRTALRSVRAVLAVDDDCYEGVLHPAVETLAHELALDRVLTCHVDVDVLARCELPVARRATAAPLRGTASAHVRRYARRGCRILPPIRGPASLHRRAIDRTLDFVLVVSSDRRQSWIGDGRCSSAGPLGDGTVLVSSKWDRWRRLRARRVSRVQRRVLIDWRLHIDHVDAEVVQLAPLPLPRLLLGTLYRTLGRYRTPVDC